MLAGSLPGGLQGAGWLLFHADPGSRPGSKFLAVGRCKLLRIAQLCLKRGISGLQLAYALLQRSTVLPLEQHQGDGRDYRARQHYYG
jgi:hypothetical protein